MHRFVSFVHIPLPILKWNFNVMEKWKYFLCFEYKRRVFLKAHKFLFQNCDIFRLFFLFQSFVTEESRHDVCNLQFEREKNSHRKKIETSFQRSLVLFQSIKISKSILFNFNIQLHFRKTFSNQFTVCFFHHLFKKIFFCKIPIQNQLKNLFVIILFSKIKNKL